MKINAPRVIKGLLNDYQLLDTSGINQGDIMNSEVDKMLRDSVALAVLQGYIQGGYPCTHPNDHSQSEIEKWCNYAYKWADALLAARGIK